MGAQGNSLKLHPGNVTALLTMLTPTMCGKIVILLAFLAVPVHCACDPETNRCTGVPLDDPDKVISLMQTKSILAVQGSFGEDKIVEFGRDATEEDNNDNNNDDNNDNNDNNDNSNNNNDDNNDNNENNDNNNNN